MITRRITGWALAVSDLLCVVLAGGFMLRGPLARMFGRGDAVELFLYRLALGLIVVIPASIALYLFGAHRRRAMRFEPALRLHDVSVLLLGGFWLMLAGAFALLGVMVGMLRGFD